MVSPWTTIICAPNPRASFIIAGIKAGGTCVISAPGSTGIGEIITHAFDYFNYPGDDQINIRLVNVVCNGQGAVTLCNGPPDEFGRNKFAVAEYAVSMQIYHGMVFKDT